MDKITEIKDQTNWIEEIELLRKIVNSTKLKEVIKWKQLCYTFNGKNVAMISGFKDSFVLSFFKGALIEDVDNILVKPGKNSQADKMFRFENITDIDKYEKYIIDYINQAIEIEKSGQKIIYKDLSEYNIPDELSDIFKSNPDFESKFYSLTKGRIKGYLLFFNGAKKSETRINRIKKYMDRIMDGKGMNDCVCGLSKRMPICDGSHKI